MALQYTKGALAAAGSTGNNTHTGFNVSSFSEHLLLNFRITAVGATPTVTFKFQVSYDDPSVADGSADWFDIAVRALDGTAATTFVVSSTKTGVGNYGFVVPEDTGFKRVRVVTSANTNVTYSADVVEQQH